MALASGKPSRAMLLSRCTAVDRVLFSSTCFSLCGLRWHRTKSKEHRLKHVLLKTAVD